MTELSGRPAYHQVADDLRTKIDKGKLPPGSQLASTAEMMRSYGVSSTVIKAAVNQLRLEGLVIGQQGKGVFVRERTAGSGRPSREYDAIMTRLSEVQDELAQLNDRVSQVEAQVTGGQKRARRSARSGPQ
jgi:GntR family transcriptional regulator